MKNVAIVGLVILVVVVVWDFSSTTSKKRTYDNVQLGMAAEQVYKVVSDGGSSCGALPWQLPDPRVCSFEDPWRIYIVKFSSDGRVNHKSFSFRRSRGLLRHIF